MRGGAIAYLAGGVVAPPPHVAVAGERQAVIGSGRDSHDTRQGRNEGRLCPLGRRLVAEFAPVVRAPREQRTIGHDGQRMRGPGRNAHRPGYAHDNGQSPLRGRAVAKLRAAVAAPAPQHSVAANGERVGIAAARFRRRQRAGHRVGRRRDGARGAAGLPRADLQREVAYTRDTNGPRSPAARGAWTRIAATKRALRRGWGCDAEATASTDPRDGLQSSAC